MMAFTEQERCQPKITMCFANEHSNNWLSRKVTCKVSTNKLICPHILYLREKERGGNVNGKAEGGRESERTGVWE